MATQKKSGPRKNQHATTLSSAGHAALRDLALAYGSDGKALLSGLVLWLLNQGEVEQVRIWREALAAHKAAEQMAAGAAVALAEPRRTRRRGSAGGRRSAG